MKAKIIFVILIFLLLILCFYVSRNNQSIEISNNKKESFQSSVESEGEQVPDEYQTMPLYSISITSTPFLCYLESLNRNGKTYVNNHIVVNEISTYIPIKITPLCKYDNDYNKLLFYFIIDTIDESDYQNYDPSTVQPSINTNTRKYRNLPLMSNDGNNIYKYKVKTETDYTGFTRVKTDLTFMLPHSTDPIDLSSDRDITKLTDIDMKLLSISKNTDTTSTSQPMNQNEFNISIPKLINSNQLSSLRNLGMTLFNFTINPEDIEIIYKPSINYTETYQLSSNFYSYQKLNCVQISIILRNNKYLNFESPGDILKLKFILQSVKDTSNDELIYNTDNYPNNIFNEETNFNINKESYQLNFYLSDTEYHKIGTQPLQLVGYLYSNGALPSGRSNPSALYYEKITNFNLPTNIINRPADERILSGIQDTKAQDLLVNYNVYPTFGLNREIEVSPSEGFKDINPKLKNKIKKRLISSRLSKLINKLNNYTALSIFKKNDKKIKESFTDFKQQCTYLKNYNNDDDLLKDFKYINFRNIEKFQEDDNTVSPTGYYNDNMLIIDELIMNVDSDDKKSFNSKMSDYMYPNNTDEGTIVYNEVKVTQTNIKESNSLIRQGANPLSINDNKSVPLELYRLEDDKTLSSQLLSENNQLDIRFLVKKNMNDMLSPNGNLADLASTLNIKSTNINYVNYQYNEEPQENIYSENLLFKARSGPDGTVLNRLIRPGSDTSVNSGLPEATTKVPQDFKLNVYNNTSIYNRGKSDSRASCDWKEFSMLFIGIIIMVALIIAAPFTGGTSLGFAAVAGAKLFGVTLATSVGLANVVAFAVQLIVYNILLITSISLMIANAATEHEFGETEDKILLDELSENLRFNSEQINEKLNISARVVTRILYSCTLNFRDKSATTEDFINIKSVGNIENDETYNTKITKHQYRQQYELDNENESFNDPDIMHTDVCKDRIDLLTMRKFEDKNDINFVINGFIPEGVKNYGNDKTNRLTPIGSIVENQYIQHGSPNSNFVKSFKYMSDEINSEKYNSYIDLGDAGISINDFGGLNYKEMYKNYISSGDGDVISGILNFKDQFSNPDRIYYDTDHHSQDNGLLLIDNNNDFSDGDQGYNHIHGEYCFIPEVPVLHSTILYPYDIKIGSLILDELYENLGFSAVNQLLITRGENKAYTETEEIRLVNESIITDIHKYIKESVSSSSDSSTSSSFDNTANFKDVQEPSKLHNSSQNNSCINKNRFPVDDPYYKYNNYTLNKFQNTNDDNYTEDTLGVLNNSSELNVDVTPEDKILRSGNSLQDRSVPRINILDGEPTEEFQDVPSEESQEPEFVRTYEEEFITNYQNLFDKFGNNSVIMEGEHYYVKIPVVYQGADFKVNGHRFYMTAELHEYPLETYSYPISESNYMNDENNYQSLFNSRLGTSIYLLNKWDKNNGFLRSGDIITFVIRIDKNVVRGQELYRNSIDCKVGGIKQFNKECRITLSDYNFLVVYLKNYDFDFNRQKLGEMESFVYKDYPTDLHQNETQHLINLSANNRMVSKRYIGRKVINGFVLNQESFFGLRQPNIPSLTNDMVYGSINESEDDHQLYFCNDDNNLASLRIGYDDGGITGIQGICTRGATTAKYGTISDDGTNSKVVPINNNKIIVGSRDLNINYQPNLEDKFTKMDGTSEGEFYNNVENGEILKNYVHEFAPYEIENQEVSINPNTSVGNDKDIFYTNTRKILGCRSSTSQRIIGFTTQEGVNGRIADMGLLCDNLVSNPHVATTTTKPVSNDVKPSLKPYRIKDENNRYIGINRVVNDNDDITYTIIFANQPPLEDHRFKFYISYFHNTDSLYYITSAKYLVENNENVLLTTTNIVNNSNQNDQVFNQLQYGEADQNHAYQIKSIEDDNSQYNISATFVLDLDKNYCSLINRSSTSRLDCTQDKEQGTKFSLEVLDEDLKRVRTTREVTQLEHELIQPRDLNSQFGFDRASLYNRIDTRDRRLDSAQRRSDTLFL